MASQKQVQVCGVTASKVKGGWWEWTVGGFRWMWWVGPGINLKRDVNGLWESQVPCECIKVAIAYSAGYVDRVGDEMKAAAQAGKTGDLFSSEG